MELLSAEAGRVDEATAGEPAAGAAAEAEVVEDLRELARVTSAISTRSASNSFLLARIARTADEQSQGVDALASAIEQTARGSQAVAGSAERTRVLARDLRSRAQASFGAMERALDHVGELESAATATAAAIGEVGRASEVIASLVEVIDDISAATTMLGINAAIEAAHAGDAGRGFAVVAAEIKKLADSTRGSAREIAKTLAEVGRVVDAATRSARSNAEHARGVSGEAAEVRSDLGAMGEAIEGAGEQLEVIASTVAQQSATLQDVARTVKQLAEHARSGAGDARSATELGLDALSRRAFAVLGRYELGGFADTIRARALAVAEEVEAAIEACLARGTVSPADVFDTAYREVGAAQARRFAHLFDVGRVGPGGFTPPKYATRWDAALDEPLRAIVDRECAGLSTVDYLCIVDLNGYLTMHAPQYRRPITGDPARDLVGNRVKRIFEDPAGMRAARCGLAGAEAVPLRAPRAAFRAAGVDLRRPPGRRPTLLQSYARDTGVVLNDLCAPVYVRGEHWGAVRFAFDPGTD